MITIGSLFSGIGGLELGLEWGLNEAGIQTDVKWQCEIEDFPRRVLAKHWPDATRYTDVRTMGIDEDLQPVDLICGGFPCQDISTAGQQKGFDGNRSSLFYELMRIVCLVRPQYIILENVTRLLSLNDGHTMGCVLGSLAESGYDAEWDCIPAAAVGAPHQRDRVFILAYSNSTQCERRWPFKPPQRREACIGLERTGEVAGFWAEVPVPRILGVAHRVTPKLDINRLASSGNAVVPQVAKIVGKRLAEVHR